MRTSCPTCDTTYVIPDDRIGPKGRKVRCARCATEWLVSLEDAEVFEAVAVPAAAAPPRPAAPAMAPPEILDPPPRAEREPEPSPPPRARDVAPPEDRPAAAQPEPAPVRFETEPGTGSFFASDATWPVGETADTDVGFAPMPDETDPDASKAAPKSLFDPEAGEHDVVDKAEVEDLAGAQKLKRMATLHAASDIESIKRLRSGKALKQKNSRKRAEELRVLIGRIRPFVGMATLAIALAAAGLAVSLRETIVANFPDLASLYKLAGMEVNLRGLVFQKLDTLREMDNGQPVLVIEGSIQNVSPDTRAVPALRLALRSDDQQEIYAWAIEPRADSLAPGETLRFRSRLATPPDQAADLMVRFTDRRNKPAAPATANSRPPADAAAEH